MLLAYMDFFNVSVGSAFAIEFVTFVTDVMRHGSIIWFIRFELRPV